jgi:lipopolysaccharide/colanic/teichoic acid biosynthesis glycosyltransferase
LINIPLSDTSLVGPACQRGRRLPGRRWGRQTAKPGLTGCGRSPAASTARKESVRLDLTYVDTWTIGIDISILLRTVSAVFRSSGAY